MVFAQSARAQPRDSSFASNRYVAVSSSPSRPDARHRWPLTLGFYEGELLRRVDPRHRSLGQFFQDEIATPLGLDFFIRLPEEIPHSPLRRSFRNPRLSVPLDPPHVYARNLEVPTGGGVGTARALARAYGVFATGGHELGLRRHTFDALRAPAVPPKRGFFDECLKIEWQLSLGFLKRGGGGLEFGSPSAFGMPGWGGTLAFADPEVGAGYAYVTNRMGFPGSDPRDMAVRAAFRLALDGQG